MDLFFFFEMEAALLYPVVYLSLYPAFRKISLALYPRIFTEFKIFCSVNI